MNNAVFRKAMENIRKHRDIKLVTTDKRRNQLVSEPNNNTTKWFSENLLAIEKVLYCTGVEHIPKEIKKFIGNKNTMRSTIIKYIFRIQTYDSIMCGYFCIGFIDFMLKDKSLIDFTNLFLPNN